LTNSSIPKRHSKGCLSGPSEGEGEAVEGQETLLELLDRLDRGLRGRVVRASVRNPELLFEEPDDLNLVLELKERVQS
jgi:hypothetical protein